MNKYPRRDAITAGAEADHSEQTLFTASPQSFQLIGRAVIPSPSPAIRSFGDKRLSRSSPTQSLGRASKSKPRGQIAAGVFARVCRGGNNGAIRMSKKPHKQALQKQKTTTPSVHDNPWLEAAAEAGSEFGKILKFAKGEWQIGEDTVPEGTEYIAYIDETARARVKFEDHTVVDRQIVKVRDGKPPAREALGDNDPSQWEVDETTGKPRDPWVMQWLLPLSPVDAEGDLTVFATSSKGGIGAIGTLCQVYGRSLRNGLLPIVALKTRTYKHKAYGKIQTPDLPIVGWHGTAATPATPAAAPIDDEVPY
jgi:hypothetical protein